MNFRVINGTEHPEQWRELLSRVTVYDFYHTPSYQLLDKTGEARLLVFEKNQNIKAIPLIFRRIHDSSDLQDVSSVYGYAGWIGTTTDPMPELYPVMQDYFRGENVVSAFSRLNPLIPGSDNFECGEVVDLNTTLGIDLTLPEEYLWRSYSESVRRSIRHSEKKGVTVRFAVTIEDILSFAETYRSAMIRLKASLSYFFPDDYFIDLMRSNDYRAFILLAEINGKQIGGGVFVICNQIMQYHLGAVAAGYQSYSPLKLIIDKARRIGMRHHLSVLHLGGGYGGVDDSLYIFKSRMSTTEYKFKVWRWITNEEQYASLSEDKPEEDTYFPLYRK